jgi:hypothetical protein
MKKLIRKILKEESSMESKVNSVIEKNGIFTTIKMFGGYERFQKLLPDYFSNRDHKVDLINGIVDNDKDEGYIYMYEINGADIKIWEEEIEDGHTQEDYITFVGDETVGVSVYEYDEEGEMYDEEVDGYHIKLTQLKEVWLNKIFEILVDYYL